MFVVNSLLDGPPTVDGTLTLREAITAADANAPSGDAPAGSTGLDTITFAPSLAFGTINLESAQGQFLLNGGGDLRISGPVPGNADGLVISGRNATRVFAVVSPDAVTIENLTITRGAADTGAGLLNAGSNTVLSCVAVTQSAATNSGGGIDNGGGTLTLTRCTVSGNSAGGGGGGIFSGSGSDLTVEVSRVTSNSAGTNGGGLLNSGDARIGHSTIAANFSSGEGGGVEDAGTIAILRLGQCTISENQCAGSGGGAFITSGANLTADDSTFAGNTGVGGAVYNDASNVSLYTCTIARNADVSNTTNGAGGIATVAGTFTLENSIVSLNVAGPACPNPNVNGTITTSRGNFIGGDPRLGPLADNGGPTLTMAPLPGSPVIDRGNTGLIRSTRDQRGGHRLVNGDTGPSALIDVGAVEFSPGPIHPLLAGADAGSAPEVKVFGGIHGALRYDFLAYASGFTGGVRVAAGDVTGDGVDDYVTGPGPGGGPQVNVYDGASGGLVKAFMAFAPNFTGGVFVAVGDVNRDGFADVVVGQDAGGGPVVSVFSGKALTAGAKTLLSSFLAYDPSFRGGVRVAVTDLDPELDGFADVVTGKGPGAAPRVRAFSGNGILANNFTPLLDFMAYDPSFAGGVYVAAATSDGGSPEIATGAGAGGGPAVNVFDGFTGAPVASFFAYSPGFGGGVRVAAADLNGDGFADIITGRGPGGEPTVKVFDGQSLAQGPAVLDRFDAFDLAFAGGVFVGGA